jgi:xanthine dehydrogenase large subunit
LTSEELWWDGKGQLRTHAPSTYKIPSVSDWPAVANVRLFEGYPNHEDTIYNSKAVGEPPLMLGISVLLAIRHAVASCGPDGALVDLVPPATPEAVLRAIESVQAQSARLLPAEVAAVGDSRR